MNDGTSVNNVIQILTKSYHFIITVLGVVFIYSGEQVNNLYSVIIGIVFILLSTLLWYYHLIRDYKHRETNFKAYI